MTRSMKWTLMIIAIFFLGVAASFIWFVATWDPAQEQPVVQQMPVRAPDRSEGLT